MTLQSSPPISLNDIKAEFGATGSRGITDFYRGGAFVPDSPANAGVPTSGAIDVLDFLGASNLAVALSNETISATAISPANATATYQLNSNGLVQGIRNGSTSTEGTWLLGGVASDFEVLFHLDSGALDGGSSVDLWMNCGTTRNWTRTRTADSSGTNSAVGTITIRLASSGAVLDSATVTLNATVDI